MEVEFLTSDGDEMQVGRAIMTAVPRVGETVILHGFDTYDMKVFEVTGVTYWANDITDGFSSAFPCSDCAVYVKQPAIK